MSVLHSRYESVLRAGLGVSSWDITVPEKRGKKDGNPNSRRTKQVEGESYLRLWLRVVGGTSKKSVEDM
jgi:hypothetical protein